MSKKSIAINNDNRLLDMVTYWETKGGTLNARDPNQILNRFNEFKGLIRRGSFTMEQLEDMVYSKYGIMSSLSSLSSLATDQLVKDLEFLSNWKNKEKAKGKHE